MELAKVLVLAFNIASADEKAWAEYQKALEARYVTWAVDHEATAPDFGKFLNEQIIQCKKPRTEEQVLTIVRLLAVYHVKKEKPPKHVEEIVTAWGSMLARLQETAAAKKEPLTCAMILGEILAVVGRP